MLGCIFNCFITREVVLEVCANMMSDSFLNAFFRFFNSTGHATTKIWCDNGTNLKGGDNELRKSVVC